MRLSENNERKTKDVRFIQKENVKREGTGLAFFYYAPTTSMVAVPMGSEDVPFIFEEKSADFQQFTVQGQVTYRISDQKKVSDFLNFSIN